MRSFPSEVKTTLKSSSGRGLFSILQLNSEFANRFDDKTQFALGGQDDLQQRVLRTVSEHSFAEDPLRIVRGLRLVSQLDLAPDERTLTQMADEAISIRLVFAPMAANSGNGEASCCAKWWTRK